MVFIIKSNSSYSLTDPFFNFMKLLNSIQIQTLDRLNLMHFILS
jgi:hypothetical protein